MLDAEISGKLDVALKKALSGRAPITFLRLAEVEYVSSSGMGLLIKYSDLYRAAGGELGLIEVSPKITALFRMLGLLSVLRTFPDIAKAVSEIAGAPAPVAAPPIASPAPGAAPAPVGAAATDGVVLPLTCACKGCQTRLVLPENGFYRCPSCGTCYEVAAGKPLKAFLGNLRMPFEAVLPYDPGCVDGILAVLGRMSESAGIPEAERARFVKSSRSLIDHLIEKGKGRGRILRVLIASDPGECLVGFRTDVKVANGTEDPALKGAREGADRLEISEVPPGNLFKIWKQSPAGPRTPGR